MGSEVLEPGRVLARYALNERGLTDDELSRPYIAVFYEDGCGEALEDIKYGIRSSGCAPLVFSVPALDEAAAADAGKSLLLAARESVADLIETITGIYAPEGVVAVGASESCIAGMLLGAVRKNLPFVFMPAILKGKFYPSKALIAKAAVCGGKANSSSLDSVAHSYVSGRSAEMDNANSLCVFCEGAGLTASGAIAVSGVAAGAALARKTGELAAKRVQNLSSPRKSFCARSFKHGVTAHLAAGGTVASLLHIIAIGRENGLDADFKYIEEISAQTPLLCSMLPSGEDDLYDFARAGGVMTLLKELDKKKLVAGDVSYDGVTLSCLIKDAQESGGEVIKNGADARNKPSGVAVIKGALAETGLARRRDDKAQKLMAYVFDSGDYAAAAVLSGSVPDGCALVIKGQSARDNGMPLIDVESALIAMGLSSTVIVTDGRTVELGVCATVSLIDKTEAFEVIANGDMLDIDFKKMKISLDVPAKELNARLKKKVDVRLNTGSLLRYTQLAGDANTGCMLKNKF